MGKYVLFVKKGWNVLEFRYKDETRNGVAEGNLESADQEFSAKGCFVYLA